MSRHSRAFALHVLLLSVPLFAGRAHADPYLAVQMGVKTLS